MAKEDTLEVEYRQVLESAMETGIEIIEGSLDEPNGVRRLTSSAEHAKDFIQQAKKLNVVVLVLEMSRLETDDIAEAREALKSDEPTEGTKFVTGALEECAERVGQIASLSLTYFLPGTPVSVNLSFYADWWDSVYRTADLIREMDEEDEDDDEEVELSEEESELIARQLAEAPKFQAARTNSAREFVARKLLAAQLKEKGISNVPDLIIQLAKNIYESEIVPERDMEIRTQVETLLAEGHNRAEIARRLKIPKGQIYKYV